MTASPEHRRYIGFDPAGGYPGGTGVFYECGCCEEVIPSLPSDSVMCKCRNIRIDVDYGRVAVSDSSQLKVFIVEGARDD